MFFIELLPDNPGILTAMRQYQRAMNVIIQGKYCALMQLDEQLHKTLLSCRKTEYETQIFDITCY